MVWLSFDEIIKNVNNVISELKYFCGNTNKMNFNS